VSTVAGAGLLPARSRVLTAEECQAHLEHATLGRVAWTADGLVHILPVSCVLHAGRVTFRTSPYGVLAGLERPTEVAFEIDHVDAAAGSGWSVVVQGRAQAVVLPQDLLELWARSDLVPWASGTRNVFIAITAHGLSGRCVQAPAAG
jgi:nitroimidazol reductase NimA-like FMN-containing flavoprotein (pyridoxamine 5'-phosphate oxidase superfamily)